MDLKGRNFLTLKDFTPEEITYLLDLSVELKEKKKKGIPVDKYRGMNVALIFEKTSTRTRCSFEVWVWERLTLILQVHRSGRKKVSKIQQEFSEECLMESSIVDLDRRWWRNWPNMQAFRYGTD